MRVERVDEEDRPPGNGMMETAGRGSRFLLEAVPGWERLREMVGRSIRSFEP
jgi:hypothetical protein